MQAAKDLAADIFGGRHDAAELGDFFVQIFLVEGLENFALDERVEVAQICDHPGRWINRAGDSHFQRVIVPVAVRIIALAIDALIFRVAQLRRVQTMRSREIVAPRKREFHARFPAPFADAGGAISEKIGRFVQPHAIELSAA